MAETEGGAAEAPLSMFGELVETSPVSLTFLRPPSLEEWVKVGEYLGHVVRWSPFAIGDWFIEGEERFPDRWSQYVAEEATESIVGVSGKTQRNYAWICRQLPPSRRRPELEFALQAEVVSKIKDPDEQDVWFDTVSKERMTRPVLRRALGLATGDGALAPLAEALGRLDQLVAWARENLTADELDTFRAAMMREGWR